MATTKIGIILEKIIDSLDVPDSAYEAAERRYNDIGEWLHDKQKAASAPFSPHIFSQGSFRLGTVTKPWKKDGYDLDLACKLQQGISKSTYTQKQLKDLIGQDLEAYRAERNILDKLEEKHRCWRVKYQDSLKFHMDIVPGIPEIQERQRILIEGMIRTGTGELLASEIAKHTMSITDNRHPYYQLISQDWQISNQEGYALWFQSRMRLAQTLLESRAKTAMVAKIDNLPTYRWKTPLQRCIQILKRHRDIMFESNSEIKPISAIITTLAARAYNGETELDAALNKILSDMGSLVSRSAPRVPNPVNTQEDFADKWPKDSRLEQSFWSWLAKAKETFSSLNQNGNKALIDIANKQFGVMLDEAELRKYDALMEKAGAISSGFAYTHKNGSIGDSGIRNQPHKFYGEE